MTIVLGILLFGLLIFVHELGHFLVARAFHMKVHAFSIGMGPAIWKKNKNEVEYSLRLLPIGGYVKLEGEDEVSADPDAFSNKSPFARLLVLCAGGFMNIVIGFLIFLILFSSVKHVTVPRIRDVIPGTPAETSGLLPGDIITEMNGKNIHIYNDIKLALMKNGASTIAVEVERDGEKKEIVLTPVFQQESRSYILGFTSEWEKMTPILSLKTAFHTTSFVVDLVYYSIGEMFTGGVKLQDLSGPVGIVNEMNEVAKSETALLDLLYFIGLIAVNLGVMNLLPIPALDGGRIFFVLIELLRRKPIPPKYEGTVHMIGFALLLLFMVAVTFSDVSKLFT